MKMQYKPSFQILKKCLIKTCMEPNLSFFYVCNRSETGLMKGGGI